MGSGSSPVVFPRLRVAFDLQPGDVISDSNQEQRGNIGAADWRAYFFGVLFAGLENAKERELVDASLFRAVVSQYHLID